MGAEGQRTFVDDEVCTAPVRERQHGDFKRRVLLVVARNVDVQATRVEFDYTIEERLPPVRFSLILGLEEGASLFCLLTDGGASG